MLKLKSPAKVNLFLKVVRRRPDGYHDLASLFQAIALYDDLEISPAESDFLFCNDPTLPIDSRNLILKAANLFRKKSGINLFINVHLSKHIPIESGLGGGSSNAATTLWAMNQLTGNKYTNEELSDWASEIGSDISFFFSQGTAYCTGRGNIVTPIAELNSLSGWIVKPTGGLSTPKIFGKLDLAKLSENDPEEALQAWINGKPYFFNDLEQPAFQIMPELSELKRNLQNSSFEGVLMSGSGSAFFCAGNCQPPKLPNTFAKPVTLLRRASDSWYM